MARKRHGAEANTGTLREAEVMLTKGRSLPDAANAIGVTERSCSCWRREVGGLGTDRARRLAEAFVRTFERGCVRVSDCADAQTILR